MLFAGRVARSPLRVTTALDSSSHSFSIGGAALLARSPTVGGTWAQSGDRRVRWIQGRPSASGKLRTPVRRLCATLGFQRWMSQGPAASTGPFSKYMDKVATQEISNDRNQLAALLSLQRLHEQLATYRPPEIGEFDDAVVLQSQTERSERARVAAESKAVKLGLSPIDLCDEGTAMPVPGVQHLPTEEPTVAGEKISDAVIPQGVYIWGAVGCGKTCVMDMFFEGAPVRDNRKQRIHFHGFMRDIIRHYHQLNARSTVSLRERYDDDLLRPLAKAIAKQSYLLCFDEIQIPDIATAAILVQLFRHLREYGVIIVATSNRSPAQLYTGHFNDTYSTAWVALMTELCEVVELASPLDYRKLMLADVTAANDVEFNPTGPFSDSFFTPLDAKSAAKMATSWRYHQGDAAVSSRAVIVAGRAVEVPECTATGVARFHFEELCARPLGPTDYLAIATEFHTVFVDEIPTMTMQTRDQARRFISLIDALYECNTVLFCSAARNAADMFTDVADVDADRYDIMHQEMMGEMRDEMDYKGKVFSGQLFTGEEELFASERCASRIAEMRCHSYRTAGHRPQLGIAGLDAAQLEYDGDCADGSAPGAAVDASDDRPRFGAQHFFGAGWWEKIVDRVGGRV